MHDDEMHELSEEHLEQVTGGAISGGISERGGQAVFAQNACPPCPHCGSTNTRPYAGFVGLSYACDDCGSAFS